MCARHCWPRPLWDADVFAACRATRLSFESMTVENIHGEWRRHDGDGSGAGQDLADLTHHFKHADEAEFFIRICTSTVYRVDSQC